MEICHPAEATVPTRLRNREATPQSHPGRPNADPFVAIFFPRDRNPRLTWPGREACRAGTAMGYRWQVIGKTTAGRRTIRPCRARKESGLLQIPVPPRAEWHRCSDFVSFCAIIV